MLLLLFGSAPACNWKVPEPSPNVLLVVIDTLRADHLGSYGYARPTSPRLDELAGRGARFANARAASSWTLPSVASIMTGLYPAVHAVETVDAVLSDRIRTMAEAFRDAGYATVALSANPAFVTPVQGLARGFERFDVLHGPPLDSPSPAAEPERTPQPGSVPQTAQPADESFGLDVIGPSPMTGKKSLLSNLVRATAEEVTSSALQWLASRPPERPFFLYLHYFDPHAAYNPPAEMARRFGIADGEPLLGPAQWPILLAPEAPDPSTLATLISLYDAEIGTTDVAIGRLLDGLPAPIAQSTIIVVTADHGEEFGDHGGLQHGRTLFDELLRVPLLLAGPGVPRNTVVQAPVSLVGLWPTLSALTGAAAAPPIVAQASFASLLRHEATEPVAVFADLDARYPGDRQRHRRALVEGSWKFLIDVQRGTELFDLAKDPGEHDDVAGDTREVRSRMRTQILDRDAVALASRVAAPPGQAALDPIRRSQLKALGYLQ